MSSTPARIDESPAHEHRYRQVLENLREVVFQVSTKGQWTYLSPAWTELTGFSVEECLGKRALEFVHPDDHAESYASGKELLSRQKECCKHEMRYRTRDGSYRWVEAYVRLVLGEDGTYQGTCGTLNDITARRMATEALARRERYLTAVVELQRRLLVSSGTENFYAPLMPPLGEASGASRVYLFEAHRGPDGHLLFSQRAEWCAPGVSSQLDNPALQNVRLEQQLPIYEQLSRGQPFSAVARDVPPERRASMEQQGIRSLLILPLTVHGTLAGCIGFDNCAEEREWDKLEVDLLSAAAGAISLTLEQRQSERALREREQRFRRLAENASDVLYRYQLAGPRGFAFVSGVVTKHLGFTPEEHYQQPELWHRQVYPEDQETLARLLSDPKALADAPVVMRFKARCGRTVWLQHVVTPVLDVSGQCVAVEGIARDITERRQAEEALKLSEASFRILIEGVPEPAAIQREGRIVYANSAMAGSLGFERSRELVGRRLEEFLLDEPPSPEGMTPLFTGERRLRRQDGKVRVAEFASLPLLFDGQPAVVCIARDVTEQRQLQTRLSLADRMASMGTLAAGIAHEINNPLAFVISNLGFLSEELARQPTLREEPRTLLNEARDGAERVRRIVHQLKTFSRPDEEKLEPVEPHAVLDSAAMLAANEIRHRARLVREYGPVPRVLGNEGRLCQVFLNLMVNAAHAIPEGAAERNEIRLVTRVGADGRVVMEVRDTGGGIPKDVLGRIFDPFFTTKPVGVGTGLGLSICHGIVTGLGGDITVESELGRGTTFRVVLPAASVQAVPQEQPAQQPALTPPPLRGRVLIVDDEPAVGRALRRILREHDVELATSGRQALERLQADSSFHAVLCDVMMPDLGGKDLYEAVQSGGSGLEQRFVFVSGGAFTPGAREFLARVPNTTLEKPFDEAAVKRVVRQLVLQNPTHGT